MKQLSLWIAGAAGEGIQTVGEVIARAFILHGYPAFSTSEFESRIRGGNTSFRIRAADSPLNAPAACRFMAACPMSPSTGIITAFAQNDDLGVFVEQAEDEIAAINMALGASAAGARAMTATSGGGFALMVEGISLAGMLETPVVMVPCTAPGPCDRPADQNGAGGPPVRDTGRTWRVSKGRACAGRPPGCHRHDYPRIRPGGSLSDSGDTDEYLRYRLTGDGISPRLPLGHAGHLVVLDSDEHDEAGHIAEDLDTVRPPMVNKRLEKGRRLKDVMKPPSVNSVEDAEDWYRERLAPVGPGHDPSDRAAAILMRSTPRLTTTLQRKQEHSMASETGMQNGV